MNLSKEPSAPRKLAALFSHRNKEPGKRLKSSVFKNADPSNLGRSLLEGNKDHLLIQERSELMKQEHQVGSLNNCIGELSATSLCSKIGIQDAQHGHIESRRESVRLQEELSVKEEVLRDTQIRSMHETREMKRAQELRVDEVSVPKLRENHETIQKFASQLQDMQESDEFYE